MGLLEQQIESCLIVGVGTLRCALPLSLVRETMRALPILAASGLAPAVLGLAVIRGVPLPVVSLARLLQQPDSPESRFVVLLTSGRHCALSVATVDGIAKVDPAAWQAMPGLLARIDAADQIRADDQGLMVSLSLARLVEELPLPERPC